MTERERERERERESERENFLMKNFSSRISTYLLKKLLCTIESLNCLTGMHKEKELFVLLESDTPSKFATGLSLFDLNRRFYELLSILSQVQS